MRNKLLTLNQAKILIAYESSDDINVLIEILKRKGYNNFLDILAEKFTLSFMKKNLPDIVFIYTDTNEVNKYEICRSIKADAELKDIPVIFICKHEHINKTEIFSSGGADYLTIPINCEECINRIEIQLKLRFMERELNKSESSEAYNNLKKLNDNLVEVNKALENEAHEKGRLLEEITMELKEFNILLEEEITERTKTEEALKESERQFRYSLEHAPIPIMLYTEDGNVKNINKVWTSITGYAIDDMPVTSEWAQVSDVFKMNLYDLDINTCNNLDFEARYDMGEFSVKTNSSDVRVWNFYSAYIGDLQDGHKLFVILGIDITERKNMEELQRKVEEERKKLYEIKEYDRIRTEFFSNISHELRTPINVIFSALQMFEISLKDYEIENKSIDSHKYTKIMKQNCHRILRLVNNIIDITKIDSGYFDISKQNINIINLIENITLSVSDYIENKGLSLIFDTDVEEKIIACDPDKIERIILNLLSNAVKFTSIGGQIMVSIEDSSENICIRIKDTGRGIPTEKLSTIFERFVQVDKSLARDHEGSGIGLSLVKSLVELHGGTIDVNSKVDNGTEFIIVLPCRLINKASEKHLISNSIGKNYIEKINIEFSDIYN